MSARERLAARNADAQAEWFISEVQRHRELGIPLGCCDEWPECSHILAYYEEHRDEILGRVDA